MTVALRLCCCLALIAAAMALPCTVCAQFEMLPSDENTYVVHADLRGLRCVEGVGTATSCAVPDPTTDEGGYPWTKVQCRKGDRSVGTFAWSLDEHRSVAIFEAPAALSFSPTYRTINVRLGRTCLSIDKAKTP